jgi:hypothetical protein
VFKEKYKLADKWDSDMYITVDIPSVYIPVFVVRREDRKGYTRTLHQNFLLPFTCISPEIF